MPYANRVGLIVEKSSPAHLDVVFNIVNTVRAVHGVDISEVVVTEEPIGSHFEGEYPIRWEVWRP